MADSTDAMRSDRPYRKALTVKETMREITRNRGAQFDPMVADVMLGILDLELRTEVPQATLFPSPA